MLMNFMTVLCLGNRSELPDSEVYSGKVCAEGTKENGIKKQKEIIYSCHAVYVICKWVYWHCVLAYFYLESLESIHKYQVMLLQFIMCICFSVTNIKVYVHYLQLRIAIHYQYYTFLCHFSTENIQILF